MSGRRFGDIKERARAIDSVAPCVAYLFDNIYAFQPFDGALCCREPGRQSLSPPSAVIRNAGQSA
jgi:hypothetical protein